MDLRLFSWNSYEINNSNPFKASFPLGQKANLTANVITIPRADDDPFLSDTQLTGHTLVIEIYVAGGQNINTSRETVKQYFNVRDKTRHNLIAKDYADSDKQYYVTGFPIGVQPLGQAPENGFTVRLALEHNYWQLVNASSDSWDITATGDTVAITNAGNIRVPPVFTFTPTTTKTAGLKYRRYIPVYNNLDQSYNSPLDITNGGLDVQTLIDAGKLQASGNDLRVWLDSSFSDRWLYGMDSDSDPAQCWINFAMQPRKEGTTSATFDSDDTTLSFTQTRASLQFLRALKQVVNPTLLIESEAVTFTVGNIDLINYQITSVVRDGKGTTAVSHAAPQTVRHIEHDLWLMYGDSDLGTPDVDDDYKPIIDLDSTNNAWRWTNYFDESSHRSGMWNGGVDYSKTGLSYVFTAHENTYADPSTVLGMALKNYGDSRVQFEAGTVTWMFSHPAGITNVVFSGEKYYTSSDSDSEFFPATVGLQYLAPNASWVTASNQTAPNTADSWEAFSDSSSFGGTYEAIRFVMDGALAAISNETAMVQFDSVTATFDSDNVPTMTLNAEETINFFDFKLTNSTTGEFIKVQTPCPLNTSLTIDCENKLAYLADGTPVNVSLSTNRDAWLDLEVGSNTLQYDDVGTVAVDGTVVHRDRVL